jgi:signal transduction histidine kinase
MPRRLFPDPEGESPEDRPDRRPERRLEPRQIQLSNRALQLFDEADTNGYYFVIWSRNRTELRRSTNAPTLIPPPDRLNAGTRIHERMNQPHREAYQLTGFGDCVLAGRQITTELRAMRRFAGWLTLAGIAVLGLGLGGGWALASRALEPVHAISSAASRISAGNLTERINLADTDNELGRLAAVLNSTFARLEAAFAQQRQFTADASHELRTPLTVMISEAQTTLARERTAAEYRESVQACLDTAQSMRKLTQSLLELARLDAGQERLDCSAFDLADRVRTCVDLVTSLARSRHLHIECDLQTVAVHGDPDRLSQVVINLLTNAVHYNQDGGRIRISTYAEPDTAQLTVANTGSGIPETGLEVAVRAQFADHGPGFQGLRIKLSPAHQHRSIR